MRRSLLIKGVVFISFDIERCFICTSAQNVVDFASKYSSLVKSRFSYFPFFKRRDADTNSGLLYRLTTSWTNLFFTFLLLQILIQSFCYVYIMFLWIYFDRFFNDEISADFILRSVETLSLYLSHSLHILSSDLRPTCCNLSLFLITSIFKGLRSWQTLYYSACNLYVDFFCPQASFLHASSSFLFWCWHFFMHLVLAK